MGQVHGLVPVRVSITDLSPSWDEPQPNMAVVRVRLVGGCPIEHWPCTPCWRARHSVKTFKHLYPVVISFSNLLSACYKPRKGRQLRSHIAVDTPAQRPYTGAHPAR
jgi:hypothetical protein